MVTGQEQCFKDLYSFTGDSLVSLHYKTVFLRTLFTRHADALNSVPLLLQIAC